MTLPRGVVVAFVAALLALGAAGVYVSRDASGNSSKSSTHAARVHARAGARDRPDRRL